MANLYFIKHTTVEMSPHGRIQTTCAMIQGCRKVVHQKTEEMHPLGILSDDFFKN